MAAASVTAAVRSSTSGGSFRLRSTSRGIRFVFLATFLSLLALPSTAAAFVYWTGNGSIGRANLDGSGADTSIVRATHPTCGVAVDSAHVYWGNGRPRLIGRAHLSGSGGQVFIPHAKACGIAVDASHLYWVSYRLHEPRISIARANLDGSNVDFSFITDVNFTGGVKAPCGVAVDGAHVYWAGGGGNSLGRANLDGNGVENNFIVGGSGPCGVAVDGAHIYWGNSAGNSIGRANLDGTDAEQNFITGASYPCGVAVDSFGQSPTATTVYCRFARPRTCTATVTDMAASPSTPTGTVAFTSSRGGAFSPAARCTLGALNARQAACKLRNVHAAPGRQKITASYAGDAAHGQSSGTTSVVIAKPSTASRALARSVRDRRPRIRAYAACEREVGVALLGAGR